MVGAAPLGISGIQAVFGRDDPVKFDSVPRWHVHPRKGACDLMLVLYDRLGCFCCNKPSKRAGHDPVDLVQCGVARGEGAAAGACEAASRCVCVRCGGVSKRRSSAFVRDRRSGQGPSGAIREFPAFAHLRQEGQDRRTSRAIRNGLPPPPKTWRSPAPSSLGQ